MTVKPAMNSSDPATIRPRTRRVDGTITSAVGRTATAVPPADATSAVVAAIGRDPRHAIALRVRAECGIEIRAGQAGHIGDIAGYERKHARGQEADEAGRGRDADREDQRSVRGDRREAHDAAVIMSVSCFAVIEPRWMAAMWPVASMTSVLGIADGGTWANCSATRPDGSKMLG